MSIYKILRHLAVYVRRQEVVPSGPRSFGRAGQSRSPREGGTGEVDGRPEVIYKARVSYLILGVVAFIVLGILLHFAPKSGPIPCPVIDHWMCD